MSTWTDRIRVAFPASEYSAATRLGSLIDPDVGGAETFSLDRTLMVDGVEYIYASIPFLSDFLPVVEARDAETWYQVMTKLAESRNREALTREEIETLCATMLIGDEERGSE